MKNLLTFILLTTIGFLLGQVTHLDPIQLPVFSSFSTIALMFGLYISVASIDLESLGPYKKTAAIVTTIGVPIQIFATGLIMYLIYPHPISFLIAVAIDQIDPLSVTALLRDKFGMSTPAKNLLKIWAAFDDPVTVLVGFSLLLPLIGTNTDFSLLAYFGDLVLNCVPPLLLYFAYKALHWEMHTKVQWFVLLCACMYGYLIQGFLFIALIALFIRPFNPEKAAKAVDILYLLVILIVGMATAQYGIDVRLGLILALVEFFIIQPVSALVLVNGTTNDIFRLAFAQQNGITTILMALAFQAIGINALPILLPAIICINFFNLSINGLYSWKEKQGKLITGYSLDKKSKLGL